LYSKGAVLNEVNEVDDWRKKKKKRKRKKKRGDGVLIRFLRSETAISF